MHSSDLYCHRRPDCPRRSSDSQRGALGVGGAHGKPRVEAAPQLHVSISHAADRLAVAVTALGPAGVDLEPAEAGDFDGLADVALTPRERLALRRLPSEQRSSAALT